MMVAPAALLHPAMATPAGVAVLTRTLHVANHTGDDTDDAILYGDYAVVYIVFGVLR